MRCLSVVRRFVTFACFLCGLLAAARPASAFTWSTELVHDAGAPDIGELSSIAIDAAGRPHIAYFDVFNQDLRYARKDASGVWRLEIVESAGNAGFGLSIALNAAGTPHISYLARSSPTAVGDVKLARRTCIFNFCSWSRETVAAGVSSSTASGNTSLAFDPDGNPNVAYFDNVGGQLEWAEKLPDVGWNVANVFATPGGLVSLAIDSFGFPQLTFNDSGNTLRHAKIVCVFILCGWNFETIDTGARVGSVELSSADQPHVAFIKSSVVRYSTRTCNASGTCAWSNEIVGNALNGPPPVLTLTSGGAPRVAFLSPRGGSLSTLNFASRTRFFGWSVEVVDFDASGFGLSAALDASGLPHLSYQSFGGGDLRYAKGAPSLPPPILPATELAIE